jgi:ABC-type protease/lipase transport system fused ATPase/permease subunit
MDVKSTFLNGFIKKEVYVEQLSGLEDEEYPNHVYKLHKTFYELKQAPRVWYECLRDFLIENSFRIGKVDSTLFTRKWANIYLYVKYMLMTSFFVILINHFMMSLARS